MVALLAGAAHPRHAIPAFHRRIGALDAVSDARGAAVEAFQPVQQRLAATGLIGDLVINALVFQVLAQRRAVMGLVGKTGFPVTRDQVLAPSSRAC